MRAVPVALIVAVSLTGCGVAGSFEESAKPRIALGVSAPPRDQAHCDGLDADHQAGIWTAWIAGASSGAAGTVAGVIQGDSDTTKGVRIGLGTGAAVLAGVAVTGTVFANSAATDWARDCAQSGASQ